MDSVLLLSGFQALHVGHRHGLAPIVQFSPLFQALVFFFAQLGLLTFHREKLGQSNPKTIADLHERRDGRHICLMQHGIQSGLRNAGFLGQPVVCPGTHLTQLLNALHYIEIVHMRAPHV